MEAFDMTLKTRYRKRIRIERLQLRLDSMRDENDEAIASLEHSYFLVHGNEPADLQRQAEREEQAPVRVSTRPEPTERKRLPIPWGHLYRICREIIVARSNTPMTQSELENEIMAAGYERPGINSIYQALKNHDSEVLHERQEKRGRIFWLRPEVYGALSKKEEITNEQPALNEKKDTEPEAH